MAPPTSSSNNRRTSNRQNRTKLTNYYARNYGHRESNADTPPANTAPGFCPAITHFTDSVAALPKELIKHFLTLKEVEAKAFEPEKMIHTLFEQVTAMPVPNRAQSYKAKVVSADGTIPMSAAPSMSGSIPQDPYAMHQQLQMELYPSNFENLPEEEQTSLRRRQVFFQLRQVIQSMLPTLDEKIHVLSSANQTISKGITRMNSSYIHLGEEISDEARFGSTRHWAYVEKEDKKKPAVAERTRREAGTTAAALAMQEEAALRSEVRREAVHAKRRGKEPAESDFDDRPASKKVHTGNRARKGTDAAATDGRINGLGISNAVAPVTKRRKVEKSGITSAPMERSISAAVKAAASKVSGGSPRETPAAEPTKKRVRAPPSSAPPKKRAQGANASPMPSPAIATFKDFPIDRAPSIRGTGRRESPPTSPTVQVDTLRDRRSPSIESRLGREAEKRDQRKTNAPVTSKSESSFKARDDVQQMPVGNRAAVPPSSPPPDSSATDAIPMARIRSTRNKEKANGGSHTSSESNAPSAAASKASHKKRPSVASAQVPAPSVTAVPPLSPSKREQYSSDAEGQHSSEAGDLSEEMEVDEDGDEPRYCICNGVSHGNMIGCDNDDCPRLWFHWSCVGIKKEPGKAKWYCDECLSTMNKKSRPGSSRA